MSRLLCAFVVAALIASPSVKSQDCIEPPFTEIYEHRGSVEWSPDVGCGFLSTLTGDTTSAATVHTVRRDRAEPLRMFFRVDLAALENLNALQAVSLASAVSQNVVGSGSDAYSDLFRFNVRGNLAGDSRVLDFTAACSTCVSNFRSATLPLSSDLVEIGVELDLGSGGDGEMRIWIDTGFGEPPTATLVDLDNADWLGTYRLSLGLSSPTPGFASSQSGNPVRFDRLGIADSQLVWRDFEPDGPTCDAFPLLPVALTSGNTCNAEVLLPTLAAGSTSTRAPSDIYAFTAPYEGWPGTLTIDSQADLAAFVCWEFCGPAVRCLGAATPGAPLPLADALPGEQRVIVTSRNPGECGAYTLEIDGPLD